MHFSSYRLRYRLVLGLVDDLDGELLARVSGNTSPHGARETPVQVGVRVLVALHPQADPDPCK